MKVFEIDLAAVDAAAEVQRMLAADVGNRVAEVIIILSNRDALAVTANVEPHAQAVASQI